MHISDFASFDIARFSALHHFDWAAAYCALLIDDIADFASTWRQGLSSYYYRAAAYRYHSYAQSLYACKLFLDALFDDSILRRGQRAAFAGRRRSQKASLRHRHTDE